jgi:flagellar hook-associated protein 1 FlgK
MSGLLSVGTRALQANQVALQTAGNNIANVNTPGYSRQNVVLKSVEGQYTGGGYIGKGVELQTIQRNFSAFLTRQSALASSTAAADTARSGKLAQLEGIFGGGSAGLGAAINDMLNAFSDVASAPTDLTARNVVLTRVDETAARMRASSQSLDDLQLGVTQELTQKTSTINSLAQSIATVNAKIAQAQGSGQPPNDLLDKRDQLVRDINQYIQTTSIAADDGTVGIFIGGSQPLVLGLTVAELSLGKDEFGDGLKSKLTMTRNGQATTLDENMLGGGEVAGLLRFQNNDLAEGRNLLGRLTMTVSTAMNTQHGRGLDLDGNPGGNLFTPITFSNKNVLPPVAPATLNSAGASLTMTPGDTSKFIASDYEVNFTSSTAGTITRKSDGQISGFTLPAATITIDGLNLSMTGNAGDRFLLKPFSTSASNISSVFASSRSLAIASPVAGKMGTANTGSLQQVSVVARSNPALVTPVVLTFTGAGNYTRSDELPTANTTSYAYTPGQSIDSNVPTGWSVTLQGTPKAGDTFTVTPLNTSSTADLKLNAGNASAMLGLRDAKLIDGGPLTDGYAGLIAQIGIRTQSADYASKLSSAVAAHMETDRTAVSGVNLDEEAAKLLQYQQAYQASAKMIQIAQGIFDTLIQTMGR